MIRLNKFYEIFNSNNISELLTYLEHQEGQSLSTEQKLNILALYSIQLELKGLNENIEEFHKEYSQTQHY